jgi:hypothetical protein
MNHMNHIIPCGHFHPYQFDQIENFHQNHCLIYCFHPYGMMSCGEFHSHGLISSMKTKVQKLILEDFTCKSQNKE